MRGLHFLLAGPLGVTMQTPDLEGVGGLLGLKLGEYVLVGLGVEVRDGKLLGEEEELSLGTTEGLKLGLELGDTLGE